MYSIILAGGSGSRLWPLSRELYPKQLLNIQNKESLLQETFKRVLDIVPAENIVSVTNTKHAANIKYQLSSISNDSVVISEPIAKNTAPAIALAVKYIEDKLSKDDEIILVLPSDHKIKDLAKFKASVEEGKKLAQKGYLVTFGVKPDYAETGFGYIEIDKALDCGYKVKKFVEKPDDKLAEKYYNNPNYFWNSGIFMFKVSTFRKELKAYASNISNVIDKIDFTKSEHVPYTEFENFLIYRLTMLLWNIQKTLL